jgi:hypothetical protein
MRKYIEITSVAYDLPSLGEVVDLVVGALTANATMADGTSGESADYIRNTVIPTLERSSDEEMIDLSSDRKAGLYWAITNMLAMTLDEEVGLTYEVRVKMMELRDQCANVAKNPDDEMAFGAMVEYYFALGDEMVDRIEGRIE